MLNQWANLFICPCFISKTPLSRFGIKHSTRALRSHANSTRMPYQNLVRWCYQTGTDNWISVCLIFSWPIWIWAKICGCYWHQGDQVAGMKNWDGVGVIGAYIEQSPEYWDCPYKIGTTGHPTVTPLVVLVDGLLLVIDEDEVSDCVDLPVWTLIEVGRRAFRWLQSHLSERCQWKNFQ